MKRSTLMLTALSALSTFVLGVPTSPATQWTLNTGSGAPTASGCWSDTAPFYPCSSGDPNPQVIYCDTREYRLT